MPLGETSAQKNGLTRGPGQPATLIRFPTQVPVWIALAGVVGTTPETMAVEDPYQGKTSQAVSI